MARFRTLRGCGAAGVGYPVRAMELFQNIVIAALALVFGIGLCYSLYLWVKLVVTAIYQWFTGVKHVKDH